MALIVKRTQMAAAIEEEEGAAETLGGADAFLAANVSFKPNLEMGDRDNVTSSLSRFSRVPGARSAQIEFDVELKGSGSAGVAPALGKLLQACGFAEGGEEGVSVIYTPASAEIESLTLAAYMDGLIKMIWGARGDVSLKLDNGKPGWLHFVFTGADFSVADGDMLSDDVDYEDTAPPAFLNASLTIDDYAALIGSIEIKMGNKVALRKDANSASGYMSAVIAERDPQMSIDPETVTVGTYDFYGNLRIGSLGELTLVVTGGAGNICTITAPAVQYINITPGDREGVRTLGIDCALTRDVGDDELSIAFT